MFPMRPLRFRSENNRLFIIFFFSLLGAESIAFIPVFDEEETSLLRAIGEKEKER